MVEINGAGESKARKSGGSDKKQNAETHTCFTLVGIRKPVMNTEGSVVLFFGAVSVCPGGIWKR